jgi:hypothetical protein
MTRRKLRKLRAEVDALRVGQANARTLIALARKLGRKPFKRGKEPTYESVVSPQLRPLTIPKHGGRDLSPGTKDSILDALDDDFCYWELQLDEE